MHPKSAKQKGKRFEDFIANEIKEEGLGEAHREIGSGSGKRKGDIYSNLPFLIEAKNQKSLQWWQAIDQAKEQARIGNYSAGKWALVARDPRSPEARSDVYAVIDFWEFLTLLKKNQAPRVKEPDRELKYHIQNLKEAISQVSKRI